ncbi:hypothetical protein KIN20_010927 [Parelaphostrongylus tenuis]|uniref:Uncharacterized protein n=1 Tax=Parelaphostrongylus tenuis TaxID=148309 RepID=A0AAD5MUP7_PARTN|nr:hypothetical protein KIN20_010927 [Parelaphostrongylus tenuis]
MESHCPERGNKTSAMAETEELGKSFQAQERALKNLASYQIKMPSLRHPCRAALPLGKDTGEFSNDYYYNPSQQHSLFST